MFAWASFSHHSFSGFNGGHSESLSDKGVENGRGGILASLSLSQPPWIGGLARCRRFETEEKFSWNNSQELFNAIDIPNNGFIFLRDVVEILRYIKKDDSCDQVEIGLFSFQKEIFFRLMWSCPSGPSVGTLFCACMTLWYNCLFSSHINEGVERALGGTKVMNIYFPFRDQNILDLSLFEVWTRKYWDINDKKTNLSLSRAWSRSCMRRGGMFGRLWQIWGRWLMNTSGS